MQHLDLFRAASNPISMLHIPTRGKKLKKRSPKRRVPRGERISIQARDLAVFKLLCDPLPNEPDDIFGGFRYLTREFLYALLPEELRGGYYGFANRFTKLLHWLTLACPAQQWSAPGIYTNTVVSKHTVYEIDTYGASLVDGTRPLYDDPSYAHALFSNFSRAYFRISLNAHPEFRFIPFKEILNHPACPVETRQLAQPHILKIGKRLGQNRTWVDDVIIPDLPMFGIERKRPDGTIGRVFVILEVDTGSEPQRRERSKGTDVYDKFVRYNKAINDGIIARQYGIKHSKVLYAFITTKETRKNNLAAMVAEAGNPGHFIFEHVSGFDSSEEMPTPHEGYLTQQWLTGSGTFSFSDI